MLIMVVAGGVAFLSGMMQNMNSQADQVTGKSTGADRTSLKLNIISSDLARPAVEPLVKAYNDKHMGVLLQLQASENLMTSNVSVGEVGTGSADIGVTDRLPSPDEMGKYPDLVAQKLGTSGIVVIGYVPGAIFNKPFLSDCYLGAGCPSYTAYQMIGSPGTEKAFLRYIGNPAVSSSITAVPGNSGMLETLKNNPTPLGFIEYGYVSSPDKLGGLNIAGLDNGYQIYTNLNYSNFTLAATSNDNITMAVATSNDVNNSNYPIELAHHLYFVTRGKPSLIDSFIKWARSFEGQDILEKNGYISYTREFN
jgi:ABC-type phosphate transport system substrate-binding protein